MKQYIEKAKKMKDLTLKEFIEEVKDNEELKNKVTECLKSKGKQSLSDELLNIAAGAGFNITNCDPEVIRRKKMVLLTDEQNASEFDKHKTILSYEQLSDIPGCSEKTDIKKK